MTDTLGLAPAAGALGLARARVRAAASLGRAARRGVTLVEILVVVALISVLGGITILGFGGVGSARLRRGATQLGGAVRVAYAHATATSKVVRLVFEFEEGKIRLEQATSAHLLEKGATGGAEAATEIEQTALAAADELSKGVRTPRAAFEPAMGVGFPAEGKDLPTGIQLWQVMTGHQDEPLGEGRAYLYFFPGGQTESAAIQLRVSNASEDDASGFMTVLVSPLTGKTSIKKGRVELPANRSEEEASEREDPGT